MQDEVKIRKLILRFFAERGGIPGDSEDTRLACEYLTSGIIDSFGVIELIAEIEEGTGVRFENTDYESPSFKTVGGLIQLTIEKVVA